MTEAEWLAATEPRLMLEFLRGKVSDRKLRLFAAFCKWEYLRFRPDLRQGIGSRYAAVTERYADGEATYEEWYAIRRNVHGTFDHADAHSQATDGVETAVCCCYADESVRETQTAAEYTLLANTLRDISGNPFRPVALHTSWRTEAVVALAEGIYAERAFERMPVLADALEDAGCAHADVLSHCRGDGPHVKGCWVVDLLTGRT
jgi:hypothetical protein